MSKMILREYAIGMLTAGMSNWPCNCRPRVWRHVGKRFADANVENRLLHGGSGVMVWAGISYGQQTQLHFIYCNLNSQRYRDKILRPIVVPFIRRHHIMFQHDNARPHDARICSQFLEAENVSVLPRLEYAPDMSPIEHVWEVLEKKLSRTESRLFFQPIDWSNFLNAYFSIYIHTLCLNKINYM
jgi:transposase